LESYCFFKIYAITDNWSSSQIFSHIINFSLNLWFITFENIRNTRKLNVQIREIRYSFIYMIFSRNFCLLVFILFVFGNLFFYRPIGRVLTFVFKMIIRDRLSWCVSLFKFAAISLWKFIILLVICIWLFLFISMRRENSLLLTAIIWFIIHFYIVFQIKQILLDLVPC